MEGFGDRAIEDRLSRKMRKRFLLEPYTSPVFALGPRSTFQDYVIGCGVLVLRTIGLRESEPGQFSRARLDLSLWANERKPVVKRPGLRLARRIDRTDHPEVVELAVAIALAGPGDS